MTFQIEHRTNLPYEEFAEQYLYRNRPVVVTDALREWKALSRWTPEFFRSEFGDMKFTLDHATKGAYGAKGSNAVEFTMSRFIDRVLESTEKDPAPYFRNQVLSDLFPSLKQDIEPLPDYFLPNWLPDNYYM